MEQDCISGFPKLHILMPRPRGSYSHGQLLIDPVADPLKLVSFHPVIVATTRPYRKASEASIRSAGIIVAKPAIS